MSGEESIDEFIERTLREIDYRKEKEKFRKKHKYTLDLIRFLVPHKNGLSRQLVLSRLEKERKANDLPIPKTFTNTVQSAFNQYCGNSSVFIKRDAPEEQNLFWSLKDGNQSVWGVNPENALSWLNRNAGTE